MNMIEIGLAIRDARKQRKLTRDKLAELSGLSRARIEALGLGAEEGEIVNMRGVKGADEEDGVV